ncbi:F-box/RNI-like superfamily protein, partial [Tanacetum coccineum]
LLLSSKAVMKRPKHSSSSNDETKQDLISNLPEALLTHILSLLPDADACRTSVLSSRWKDLWMFLPSLHFVMPFFWSNKEENELYCYVDEAKAPVCWSMEEVYKFYDLVDKTLALRDGMPILLEYVHRK